MLVFAITAIYFVLLRGRHKWHGVSLRLLYLTKLHILYTNKIDVYNIDTDDRLTIVESIFTIFWNTESLSTYSTYLAYCVMSNYGWDNIISWTGFFWEVHKWRHPYFWTLPLCLSVLPLPKFTQGSSTNDVTKFLFHFEHCSHLHTCIFYISVHFQSTYVGSRKQCNYFENFNA